MRKSKSLKERFEDKYIPEPNSGCWLWTASLESHGYGQIWDKKLNLLAHRLSYQLYKGPVAEGLCVMHSCDMPSCVNPAHLSLGTHAENIADRDAKGRRKAPSGADHWTAKRRAQTQEVNRGH